MANQRKFHTMPDEILSIIFNLIHQSLSSGHARTVNKLSLVSRRFRSIVLGLPVLWSRISFPHLRVKHAELFASRAKTHPLAISMDDSYDWKLKEPELVRMMDMYELTVSLSSRIQKLSIHISENSSLDLDVIQKTYSNASFPCLSELTLEWYTESPRTCRFLFQGWVMPSLTTLCVVSILPILSPAVFSKILTLSVEVNRGVDEDGDDAWHPTEIITFLLSCLSVVDVRISARLFSTQLLPPNTLPKMESVKRLTLHLPNTETAMESNILHLIKFPSLTSFKLDLGLGDLECLDTVLKHVSFLAMPDSVTDVTLAVGVEMDSCEGRLSLPYTIGKWCNRFKGLKSLTLDSDRRRTHGIFAFTGPIDVLKVVKHHQSDAEKMPDVFLFRLEHFWDRPHRTAVVAVEKFDGEINHQTGNIQYIERYTDRDSESDSD
ncbi:hypothetical protein SCHPADRAFT_930669 [Schizopora paradoxa]|uniref:Uncharacterized protein n=1 Tax=Schizopora paradoxa TaxID=27342 RepID=A0A0H2RL60_9AGAM|nr:hypothetical protein SCHPADRAFT_930669 [Schizopora paradoxa]